MHEIFKIPLQILLKIIDDKKLYVEYDTQDINFILDGIDVSREEYIDIFHNNQIMNHIDSALSAEFLTTYLNENEKSVFVLTELGKKYIEGCSFPVLKKIMSKASFSIPDKTNSDKNLVKSFGWSGNIFDVIADYKDIYLVKYIEQVSMFHEYSDDGLRNVYYTERDGDNFLVGLHGVIVINKKDTYDLNDISDYEQCLEETSRQYDEIYSYVDKFQVDRLILIEKLKQQYQTFEDYMKD